jgi:isopenicillin-N N-acyltransferase-like protein
MMRVVFPWIRVEGAPRERGRQLGEAARERVQRSVDAYDEVFAHVAGWDPARVRAAAAAFRAPIAAHGEKFLEEMAGIAEGAGVGADDVLAINLRTEVMFAATARDAAPAMPLECSAFAVLPGRSGGRTLVGQTWDWLAHAADTTIVVEAHQDDAPDYVTVVEAGLLAKAGMNSAGVALATNALVCAADRGAPGVPYHVLLRSMLDAETVSDAFAAITRGARASSANFLLADADGVALDVEAAPGDHARVFLGYPERDLLLHTNHFANLGFDGRDASLVAMPDSPFRLARLQGLTAGHDGPLDLGFWTAALADHAMFPFGVCCHPDPRAGAAPERYATIFGLVMDPAERRMWLAPGSPCETPFEPLDLLEVLAKPPAVRAGAAAPAR